MFAVAAVDQIHCTRRSRGRSHTVSSDFPAAFMWSWISKWCSTCTEHVIDRKSLSLSSAQFVVLFFVRLRDCDAHTVSILSSPFLGHRSLSRQVRQCATTLRNFKCTCVFLLNSSSSVATRSDCLFWAPSLREMCLLKAHQRSAGKSEALASQRSVPVLSFDKH